MSPRKKSHPLTVLAGKRIAQVRDSKGWTQIDLGNRLGVSQQWVSDIECARTTPQLDTIAKIAEVLGIQSFELLIPEGPRMKVDARRVLNLFKRGDDRSREFLSRVMECFTEYETDRKD